MSETVVYRVPGVHRAHCEMSIREEVSEVAGWSRSTSIWRRRS